MDCDLFGSTELDGLMRDSAGMIEMERKALMDVDSTGCEYFKNAINATRPGQAMLSETLNAWRNFESFV